MSQVDKKIILDLQTMAKKAFADHNIELMNSINEKIFAIREKIRLEKKLANEKLCEKLFDEKISEKLLEV